MSSPRLIVRVHYGHDARRVQQQFKKTFQFAASTKVREVIGKIFTKEGLDASYMDEYGIFVPSWRGKRTHGWLNLDSTLQQCNVESKDVIEFRPKVRSIRVCSPKSKDAEFVPVDDCLNLRDVLVSIAKSVGSVDIMPPDVNEVVAVLPKTDLLLHLPLPEDCVYIIARDETLTLRSATDEDIAEHCFLHVKVPSMEGMLLKRSKTGLYKGWKRRWWSLRKDRLYYYKDQTSEDPINFIPLQRVTRISKLDPFDTTSRKFDTTFCIEAQDRVYYLLVPERSTMDRWMYALDEWLLFKRFFVPKVLGARSRTLSLMATPKGVDMRLKPEKRALQDEGQYELHIPAASSNSSKRRSSEYSINPDREITVMLVDGSTRNMIADANLDVYELAYMVAEEIGSVNAFIMGPEDHGPERSVQLLDHQLSLRAQNVPDGAVFVIKKTGIVDDFVQANDIYDNHFMYAQLPRLFFDQPDDADPVGSIPMYSVLAIQSSASLLEVFPSLEAFAFCIDVPTASYHFVAAIEEACEKWKSLSAWLAFFTNDSDDEVDMDTEWQQDVESPWSFVDLNPVPTDECAPPEWMPSCISDQSAPASGGPDAQADDPDSVSPRASVSPRLALGNNDLEQEMGTLLRRMTDPVAVAPATAAAAATVEAPSGAAAAGSSDAAPATESGATGAVETHEPRRARGTPTFSPRVDGEPVVIPSLALPAARHSGSDEAEEPLTPPFAGIPLHVAPAAGQVSPMSHLSRGGARKSGSMQPVHGPHAGTRPLSPTAHDPSDNPRSSTIWDEDDVMNA